MPSIKGLTMTYEALNESGTFSEGDTIRGKVTLALLKEITVESFFVKVKGDANVRWTKKVGDKTHTYSSHRRYFKLKQFLLPEDSTDNVVPPGNHVYEFSLNIPTGPMPSSFRGSHGKIVYMLEVKLNRSWRMERTIEKEIIFVSKSIPNLESLMSRQIGSVNKEMGVFSKGNVHMDVIVDRRAYAPGETVAIVAKINNSSSSEMTPKFSLMRDVVFHAQSHTKHEGSVIEKVVENRIKPHTEKTVKCAIKLPRDLSQTIHNCDLISVEYHLKVYLDISFAFDPEVMFRLIIYPPDLAPGVQSGGAVGPYPAGDFEGPSNRDFRPPVVHMSPYPSGRPGAQSYSSPPPAYPAHPAYGKGAYNNLVPQLTSQYGDPYSSPSSVLHPPPTAPTFYPPPSAPEIPPSSLSPPSNISPTPTAPTYNLLPSAPLMNTDFLSQTDEPPPSYSLLFPPSASENSDAKL